MYMYAAKMHVQLYVGITIAAFIYVLLNGRSSCTVWKKSWWSFCHNHSNLNIMNRKYYEKCIAPFWVNLDVISTVTFFSPQGGHWRDVQLYICVSSSNFFSTDKILWCYHSNENSLAELLHISSGLLIFCVVAELRNSGKSAKFTKTWKIPQNLVEVLSNLCLYNKFETYFRYWGYLIAVNL